MKTQKEIEEKFEELNKMMKDMMPTEKSNKEFASREGLESLEKMIQTSTTTISIDAQRFILEWVLSDD